jgi:hypothetical protein
MAAALVRPYVRVIPITTIAPAYPRRSPVPPRPAPPEYRPRHYSPPPEHRRPPKPRRRRSYPALAWGALLLTLAATGLTVRAGERGDEGRLTAAEPGRPQIALVPAPAAGPASPAQDSPARRRPDAPTRRGRS